MVRSDSMVPDLDPNKTEPYFCGTGCDDKDVKYNEVFNLVTRGPRWVLTFDMGGVSGGDRWSVCVN